MPKGILVTDEGKKFKRVLPEETGLVPCNGEAHSNAYIDHCMICLGHRWGQMMSYKYVPLAALVKGTAVSYNDSVQEEFIAAEAVGKVKLVNVTEKTRSATSSYFAWVLA